MAKPPLRAVKIRGAIYVHVDDVEDYLRRKATDQLESCTGSLGHTSYMVLSLIADQFKRTFRGANHWPNHEIIEAPPWR